MKKPRFAPRPVLLKQIIDRSNYSIHPRSKTRMVSNRFWHIVSVVKERYPPVQQKGTTKAKRVWQSHVLVSTAFRLVFARFPQASCGWAAGPHYF